MNKHDYEALRARLGDAYVQRRLHIQAERSRAMLSTLREDALFSHGSMFLRIVEMGLRASGLYARGVSNALAIEVRDNVVHIPNLPPAFEGLRVLQISDMHMDGLQSFGSAIASVVSGLDFDVCVLTGDFRFCDTGSYTHLMAELAALLPTLTCRLGVFGIMGNHDRVEMVPMLERQGVRMLINEAAALRMDGEALWMVGVDDPHFYKLHDFDSALEGVPPDSVRVLLAHSPEVIPEAGARDFVLYLTGHTHGGQICLPNGWAPHINADCPRRYTVGAWQYNGMKGYTSRGTGASGVFVRYFCPPEVTLHRLTANGDISG